MSPRKLFDIRVIGFQPIIDVPSRRDSQVVVRYLAHYLTPRNHAHRFEECGCH